MGERNQGKLGKKGLGNLGSGILSNHKKGGISSIPPLMGWLGCAERMQVQDFTSRQFTGKLLAVDLGVAVSSFGMHRQFIWKSCARCWS